MTEHLDHVHCNNCREDKSKLLFTKNGFHIVKCQNCGLTYTNPRISASRATDIYNSSYFQSQNSVVSGYDDYIRERPAIEATFKKRVDFIMKNAPSLPKREKPKILDIGCATGFLLSIFRDMKWEVEGIELSKFAQSFAVDEMHLPVHLGSLNSVDLEKDSFDLVTSWDVIEHSYNPKKDLLKIHHLLKVGGYLAVITPNRDSLHARLVGSRWVEYQKPEEHLYFFGHKILSRILNDIGFELAGSTTAGKYVKFSFALNRLRSYSEFFKIVEKMAGKRFADKYIYVDPHDKMFLLFQKK